MGIIIQKYGGSSLKSPRGLEYLLSHVKKSLCEDDNLVIVVSAIGRKGDPYATDTLISQLDEIGSPVDPKKKDLIMSCGEIISASIVSHLLETHGIPAEAFAGFQAGIRTDSYFNKSKIVNIDTSNIIKKIEDKKVVVVAGFQGINEKGEITTLGRGGSDITAVALGGYLDANSVHIFTDVPGVAIIDPKVLPTTKYHQNITYQDMYNLSLHGAKVIHPIAVSMAEEFNIPLYIKSTFEFSEGTLISHKSENSTKNLIGITINIEDGFGKVSLLFNEQFLVYLVPHINKFISKNQHGLLRIIKHNNRIEFLVVNNVIDSFSNKLYDYFFQDKY